MLIDFRGKKYEHTVCCENNTLSYCVRPVTHLDAWEDYAKLPALTIRRNHDGYIFENEDWWEYISDDTCNTLDAHVESMWDDLCEHFETEVKEYYSDMLAQIEAGDDMSE